MQKVQKIAKNSDDDDEVNNAWTLEITRLDLAREVVSRQSKGGVQEKYDGVQLVITYSFGGYYSILRLRLL